MILLSTRAGVCVCVICSAVFARTREQYVVAFRGHFEGAFYRHRAFTNTCRTNERDGVRVREKPKKMYEKNSNERPLSSPSPVGFVMRRRLLNL